MFCNYAVWRRASAGHGTVLVPWALPFSDPTGLRHDDHAVATRWARIKRLFSRVDGEKIMSVQSELDMARRLGEQFEDLVVRKGQCNVDGRKVLLIGYWALLFDYHKGILSLLSNGFCGSAFALVRPVVEGLVRSHVVLMGSDKDVNRIRKDRYKVDFGRIGVQIDAKFGLGGFFKKFLDQSQRALHSYTHSGASQIARRFDGNDLTPRYSEDEIVEVIRVSSTAIFMVTELVTKHFMFGDEAKKADELFLEWAKHS